MAETVLAIGVYAALIALGYCAGAAREAAYWKRRYWTPEREAEANARDAA